MTSDRPTPEPSRKASRLERLGGFLSTDSSNPLLLKDYATEAWRAGEPEACRLALERLSALDGLDAEHLGLLTRALVATGQVDDALTTLHHALETSPQDPLLHLEIARTLLVKGQPEHALSHLPADGWPATLAGPACALRVRGAHQLGELEAALAAAMAFEATHGQDADVHAALLPVLTDLNRMGEARERAHWLVERSPHRPVYEVCEPLAMAALDEQDLPLARQWIDKALQQRQDDGRIWLLAALTQLEGQDAAAAQSSVARALDLMPQHAGSHLAQGWIALFQRQLDEARAAFEQGIAASPAFAEGHGSMAVALTMAGRTAEAQRVIRKALLLDPHCASAQYAQAILDGADGDRITALARTVLTRSRSPQGDWH